MQRYLYVTMVIFAILVVEGCSRARPKREPLSVNKETDFLPDDSAEFLARAKPIKKLSFGPDLPRDGKGRFEFPADAFLPETQVDWENGKTDPEKKLMEVMKSQFSDDKYEMDKKQRAQDLEELHKLVIAFGEKTEPPERFYDNLKKDVRRSNNRAMYKLVANKTVEVVLDADLAMPKHVLAYYPSPLKENDHAFLIVNGKVGVDKLDSLESSAKGQRLWAIHKVYKDYVAANPEERSYEALRQVLKEKLVAPAYEAHDKGEILLLDPVKPKGKAKQMPPIACYAVEEKEKGHLGISIKGGITYVPAPLPANYRAK